MKSKTRFMKALAALNYDLFNHPTLNPPAPATLYTRIASAIVPFAGSTAISVEADSLSAQLSEPELYRLFNEFNWLYFDGRLPFTRIAVSERMWSAGSYSSHERLIRIGRRYHEIFPEEIADTLKHEMLHILHPTHGAEFKKEAARVGASVRARSHPSLRKAPRFTYVCPKCGTEYPRQKRLRMASCGKCSRNGFDSRYKLVLMRPRTK